jgi:hypothetical protein
MQNPCLGVFGPDGITLQPDVMEHMDDIHPMFPEMSLCMQIVETQPAKMLRCPPQVISFGALLKTQRLH